MEIKLQKAFIDDCEDIHKIQVISFRYLLHKYNDKNTNPGSESIDTIIFKMGQDFSDYYFIKRKDEKIGAIRIITLQENICRISPMFILPEFQGKGYGQQAIAEAEKLYPYAVGWRLDTIKEERKLCHFYEKMGYQKTGKEECVQDNMTIVYYSKIVEI